MLVLCLTSNAYVRCLPAFAACMDRWWPEHPPVTVVHYDVEPPDLGPGYWRWQAGRQADYSWSKGLRKAVGALADDAWVLPLLDDYWLAARVDTSALDALVDCVDWNVRPGVNKVDLSGDRLRFPHEPWDLCGVPAVSALTDRALYRSDGGFKSRLYLASLQAALWRVGFLRAALRDDESAWDFEERGTERLLDSPPGSILGVREPALLYSNACKAGKPDLLRVEKLWPDQFEWLRDLGHLRSWGFDPHPTGVAS